MTIQSIGRSIGRVDYLARSLAVASRPKRAEERTRRCQYANMRFCWVDCQVEVKCKPCGPDSDCKDCPVADADCVCMRVEGPGEANHAAWRTDAPRTDAAGIMPRKRQNRYRLGHLCDLCGGLVGDRNTSGVCQSCRTNGKRG